MLSEEKLVDGVRDDIIRARMLLTEALELMSKPSYDYEQCWRKLNIANHHSCNAEIACFNRVRGRN